jgi:hypothetical protein
MTIGKSEDEKSKDTIPIEEDAAGKSQARKPVMADEKNDKSESKRPSKPEGKSEKKTETVHLSAEELRKIAGGQTSPAPPVGPAEAKKDVKKP